MRSLIDIIDHPAFPKKQYGFFTTLREPAPSDYGTKPHFSTYFAPFLIQTHAHLFISYSFLLSNYLKIAGKSGLTSTGRWWDEGSICKEAVLQCIPGSDFLSQ